MQNSVERLPLEFAELVVVVMAAAAAAAAALARVGLLAMLLDSTVVELAMVGSGSAAELH